MDGIEKIVARLNAEAKSEIAAIEAENKAECDKIKSTYDKKAQQAHDERISEGSKESDSRAQRLYSTAELAARNAILAFKQEMVTDAFTGAAKALHEMPEGKYTSFLASLAVSSAVTGSEELIFNASDREKFGQKAADEANGLLKQQDRAANLTVSADTREMEGGLIAKNGDIEVNCSIDLLMQTCRTELASRVAEILFA